MFELKRISRDGIPRALERVERYRLLQEPEQAESICLDILGVEPDHPQALVYLLLSITDQFHHRLAGLVQRAREILPRLGGEYERAYYAGIIAERCARVHVHQATPGSGQRAFDEFAEAMEWYEKAEKLRPPGNDDAILRWNSCARTIMAHHLQPATVESVEYPLE
jgi:hypothetical protein